jgi:hypothetical protein
MRSSVCFLLLAAVLVLPGCELLGMPSPERIAAQREAEGKAVGAACRHAGRAIEDCYALNKRAEKAAVFAGWREMNDYMTENKIEVLTPTLPPAGAPAEAEASAAPAAAKGGKRS